MALMGLAPPQKILSLPGIGMGKVPKPAGSGHAFADGITKGLGALGKMAQTVSPLKGLFGNLALDSGAHASASVPTEARTAALDPFGFKAPSAGRIDWKGFETSPLKANIDKALSLFGSRARRNFFGDSGIGGLFGAGGSALARSGLMSSSAGERLAQRLGGDLARTEADYGNRLIGEGLRMFGQFETSDLGRIMQENLANAERAAGIARQNQNVASMERYGDLNRAAEIARANAQLKQGGIDRQVRTRAGLFDTLFNERQKQREMEYNTKMLPLNLLTKIMSGSGSTSSHSGANPFLTNVFSKVGGALGNRLSDALFPAA